MPELDSFELRRAGADDKAVAKTEREIARRYRAVYDELEAQLSKLYAAMGDNPSIVEAKRYGRLAAVQKAIIAEYNKVTRDAIRLTQSQIASSYAEAYYGNAWAFDQATGVALKWPEISAEAIRQTVWSSETGESFAERLANWKATDIPKISRAITSGIASGAGYAKTAAKLREQINATAYQAMRIVRTESTRAYNQGHLATYDAAEELGVKARRRWVATLDTNTRDTHAALDGEYADENGLFHIHGLSTEGPGLFGDPAEDINCRCRVVEDVEGFSPQLRRIRGEGLQPYTTYEKWAKEKGWTPENGWPAEAKAKVSADQAKKY